MSIPQFDPHTCSVQQDQDPTLQIENNPRPIATGTAVIGGLLWMVAGPMILFMSTLALILKASGFWTPADGFYAAGLATIFVGRWVEFRSGMHETLDGKPFSARDLRRYYLRLGLSGLAVWMLASAIRTVWLIL
jgi:hypothetical protein